MTPEQKLSHLKDWMSFMGIDNYFEVQERYYSYLHEKLGNKFVGEARKANGMVRTHSSYHCDGWEHLSNVEKDSSIRSIALLCMEGRDVVLNIRNGDCYMQSVVTPDTFPLMKITKRLGGGNYGSFQKGEMKNVWQCNETAIHELKNLTTNDRL